ncbi:unnamed protein product [Sympodiomycopsis kandeliae]
MKILDAHPRSQPSFSHVDDNISNDQASDIDQLSEGSEDIFSQHMPFANQDPDDSDEDPNYSEEDVVERKTKAKHHDKDKNFLPHCQVELNKLSSRAEREAAAKKMAFLSAKQQATIVAGVKRPRLISPITSSSEEGDEGLTAGRTSSCSLSVESSDHEQSSDDRHQLLRRPKAAAHLLDDDAFQWTDERDMGLINIMQRVNLRQRSNMRHPRIILTPENLHAQRLMGDLPEVHSQAVQRFGKTCTKREVKDRIQFLMDELLEGCGRDEQLND